MTKKRTKEGKDRISELPDDVLYHILSFLPTEDAIATCLLSTRWRFLWTMVPAFDFECTMFTSFGMINKFWSLRKTQRITRFRLTCNTHQYCWAPCIQQWISAAVEGKVEQFSISLSKYCYKSLLYLPALFTCTTLVTLNLELKDFNFLCIPSSVHLPSLKTLHIHTDQCVPFHILKKLVYGSPALQLFHLKQQRYARFKELKILRSSRTIQLFEYKAIFNVDMFRLVIQSDRDNDFIPHYLENRLKNIVKAKAYITVYDTGFHYPLVDYRVVYTNVFSILRGLRNVEFLSLSDFRVDMYENYQPTVDDLLEFQNLVQLQLHLKDVDSRFMELHEKCPKLQVVEFNIMDQRYGINERCRYNISGGLWEHDQSIVPV